MAPAESLVAILCHLELLLEMSLFDPSLTIFMRYATFFGISHIFSSSDQSVSILGRLSGHIA